MGVLPLLTFEPVFQPYVWGGRRLAEWFATAPRDGPVAEVWLVSDEEKFPTRVAAGPFAGQTLRQLSERFAERLIGHGRWSRFPLLLKLLDAQQPLSVQVHPNDEQAGAGRQGKTEAWYILHAEPGSSLYAGFQPGVTPPLVHEALARGTLADLLHRIDVRAGDCVFLPAGTVHALGAGLLLFEIQQTSDITYRLYDWGRPRPLQVDEALACIDWTRGPIAPCRPTDGLLVDCPYFRLWSHRLDRPTHLGAEGECRILVTVGGQGQLHDGSQEYPLQPGSAWLIPAERGTVKCHPMGEVTLLECGLPKRS
jgi:mannose-6-phosphate isomerase